MTAARAYQLCDAAEVMKSLPPGMSTIVDTESKARELVKVPEVERENIVRLVQKKARATGRKPTAKDIREAAATNTSETSEPIDLAKFPAATKSKRNAVKWWWTRSTTPEKRGQFLLYLIFTSDNPVVVSSKAELRRKIDKWMDNAVEEAKAL